MSASAKTWFITGASSGFGNAFARYALAQGYNVVATARSVGKLEALKTEAPDRVLIVDIFKEYPIGNSRSWLPKAIEEDGLRVVPLLETPQMRVLQVSPPERVVRVR